MKKRSKDPGATAPAAGDVVQTGAVQQVRTLLRTLMSSPVAKPLKLLVIGVIAVVLLTAYGQVRLNQWNKPFYDALSRRDVHSFLVQLGVFCIIAGLILTLNVAQRWLVDTLKLRLREGLVKDLVGHWMQPRRAFWLSSSGPMGVNPDQRMHDDTLKLCDMSADLGVGLFQASILVASFASVLWVISNDFSFRFGDEDYAVPGFMLWAAILYAGAGSLMSYWVGRPLIHRNADRYAREADLRFSLVRINEHLDGISLAAGEADEKRRVERYLGDVLTATRKLVLGLTNLTWVTSGFGWTTTVAPILVSAPLYLSGKISFGGMMMAAAAFTQAQSSLRWFVDNFSIIADWRATLLRVANFREALVADDSQQAFDTRITYTDGAPGAMVIEGLEVSSPIGRDRLVETKVIVKAGEKILIVAALGTGKTLLFRAMAGLWPWGAGEITRPKDQEIVYMPRGTPYLPSGTLREILTYPQTTAAFEDDAYRYALRRLGLERLVPMLDQEQRWDRELSIDEQMSLAFARILLRAPPWVLIDEAFGSLDEDTLERVVDVFANELEQTSVIHIGRAALMREKLVTREIHLVKAPGSPGTAVEQTDVAAVDAGTDTTPATPIVP